MCYALRHIDITLTIGFFKFGTFFVSFLDTKAPWPFVYIKKLMRGRHPRIHRSHFHFIFMLF